MKNKIISRRLPALVLALIMLLSLGLSACSAKDPTTNAPSDTTGGQVDPTVSTAPSGPKEGEITYNIIVQGVGGMRQPGITVILKDNQGTTVATGVTDEKGVFTTYEIPGEYDVTVEGLREGYTATAAKTTTEGGDVIVVCNTALVEGKHPGAYAVGDVMRDFTFLNNEGEEVKLSDLLKTKKLVVINFWADWCGNCKLEFPVMQKAYEEYGDLVEIVALNTTDSAAFCDNFREEQGYTFTMVPDTNGIYGSFVTAIGGAYLPCTVMVDRYGVINEIEMGAITTVDAWNEAFEDYTSDDYLQSGSAETNQKPDDGSDVEKPDVEMPASSEIESAINASGFSATYSGPKADTIWPWVLTEDKTAIQPSNYGKHGSSALINMEVTFQKGQILAFDYKYSIEYDKYGTQIYDMFAITVDGDTMHTLVDPKDGWVTCYVYTPVVAGDHTVTLYYTKDKSDGQNFKDEYLYVKNMRMVTEEEMIAANGSTNIWRPAADVKAPEGSATFYQNYATVVFNSQDGYYHVGTKDGPLLLAKLTGATRWSNESLEALAYAGYLNINGIDYSAMPSTDQLRSYWWLEQHSKLGYTPVDAQLAYLLQRFAKNIGNSTYEQGWLEMCSYFEHYGVGRGITRVADVRDRIDMASAVDANVGANHAFINQTLVPRGHYYKFVPDEDGIYTFYSVDAGSISSAGKNPDTVGWLYDANGKELDSSYGTDGNGRFQIWKKLKAGETYYIGVGLDPVDLLGEFDFMIEKLDADKWDVKTACTGAWTFDSNVGNFLIMRNYDIHAELGTDGYYHQVLGYEEDGTPILDYSETGYIYLDFFDFTEGSYYIPWVGSTCTLYKYITQGYYKENADGSPVCDENGKALLFENAFDFTNRTDSQGNSMAAFGNHQEKFEQLLEQVITFRCTLILEEDGSVSYTDTRGRTAEKVNPTTDENGKTSIAVGGVTITYGVDKTEGTITLITPEGETIAMEQTRSTEAGNKSTIYDGFVADKNVHVKVDAETAEVLQNLIGLYGVAPNVEDQWMMFCYFLRHIN